MNPPNVCNTLKDDKNGVTYRIMAYRALSRAEILQSVGAYLAQNKRKKTKPGTTITILTVIGAA